jgi:hypothetical protein
MVQKQAANSIRSQGDGFADDDPLAELARIVGFDQPLRREPVVSMPPVPQMGSADFNLEDELIREFEGYEAAPAPSSYAPALAAPEPVVSRPQVVESFEAPRYREEPSFEPKAPTYSEPHLAYEPEPVEFVAAQDWSDQRYAPADDHYAADPVVTPNGGEDRFEPVAEPDVSFDLADELEFAVADADIRPEPVASASRSYQPEPPRLRLPLANFSAQPVRRSEPELAPELPKTASDFDLTSFDTKIVAPAAGLDFGKATFDWASGPVEPIPAAAPTVKIEERVFAPAPTTSADRVEQDVPDLSFDFLDDLVVEEEPLVAAKASEPVAQRTATLSAEEDEFDPFSDHEFDLQLDDIELDLADLDLAPQKHEAAPVVAPVMAAAAAPVFVADAAPVAATRAEPTYTIAFDSLSSVAPASAQPAPSIPAIPAASFAAQTAVSAAPATRTPAAAPSYAPSEPDFGFDPSEISEQDDMLETLGGMDVPDVPVTETRSVQSAQPDYDYDIDAELASLFEEPVSPPPAPKPVAVGRFATATAAANPAPRASTPALDEFDAFEKALEEDFRSSMTSSGALEPESRGHITIAGEGRGFRFRNLKPYLMAGTAVVVLLAGAGGLYAWLGSGAVGTLTGGEPQVIAADKSPVKIVPENPGGKSVPNQDKAVYDRVSGNGVEDPKQPNLISSEEEPIDVVQRTLIPETLPLEGENDVMATPVGETEDPRLLPDGQPQQAAAEDPATITPRRVRTMIVRPDGTLVAQEAPEAPVESAAVATAPQSAANTPVLAPPSVPSASASDTVRTVDTRVVTPGGAPEAPVTAPATTPTEVAAATPAAAEAAPVAEATATTAATDSAPAAARAPIPTTRPADQPVNVVGTVTDQGNVRPAQSTTAAPEQPAEVAAASPAAATPAPAATAASGSFGIQIASLPSEADAQKSYRSLSSKFGNVLGGKPWEIRQADIPGKGTFYRVRVVAGSKDEAVALCEQYRAAGGSCLVSR